MNLADAALIGRSEQGSDTLSLNGRPSAGNLGDEK